MLFYFVLKTHGHTIADQEGVELPDKAAARHYAISVARDLMRSREAETQHWRIEVCDEYLLLLFEVLFADFSEAIELMPRDHRLRLKRVARTTAALHDALTDAQKRVAEARETLAEAGRLLALMQRGDGGSRLI
jgi:hypothetical protein